MRFIYRITRLYILCIFDTLIIILRFVLKLGKLIKTTGFSSWYTFSNRLLNWYRFQRDFFYQADEVKLV